MSAELQSAARRFFDVAVPAGIAAAPARLRLGFVLRVVVEGAGVWTLDLRSSAPVCRQGDAGPADITLEAPAEVMATVVSDPEKLVAQYYRGDIRIKGDFRLLRRSVLAFIRLLRRDVDTFEAQCPGLRSVLAPHDVESFMTNHWPGVSLAVHGDVARFAWLTKMLPFRTIEELMAWWPSRQAKAHARISTDEFDAPDVTTDEAKKLFDSGLAIAFSGLDAFLPPVAAILKKLKEDLGLHPFNRARCSLYATPAGAGNSVHFDSNANFVLQLSGNKTWTIAPNTHVISPTTRFAIAGTEVAPELVPQLAKELPSELPAPNEAVTLRAGSMLFVPRGYWHTTSSTEPSLSLNFTFDSPCWASVVADAVRQRLQQDERWRELFLDLDSEHEDLAARARASLEKLLPTLAGAVAGITAADVVASARSSVAFDQMATRPAGAVAFSTYRAPPADWVDIFRGTPAAKP